MDNRTPAELMIEDGLPASLIIGADQRREAWKGRKLTTPRPEKIARKDEDPATKSLRKELAAAEAKKLAAKKAERDARRIERQKFKPKAAPASTQETTMKKPTKKTAKPTQSKRGKAQSAKAAKTLANAAAKKAAKAAKAAAPKPAKAPKGPKAVAGAKPGSKLAIVMGLLTRKDGCTSADVLKATEWPTVSMPQQAKAAGLTLRKEKDGKITRYWGAAA